jgi:N-acetylglucosaminyldiphosphoundecaprenol N-acetyl-beta-D-mannosaminyltransferase
VAAQHETIELASLRVARMRPGEAVDHVFDSLASGRGGWLLTANLELTRQAAADPAVARLYASADLIVADGAPLVWAAWLQGTPLPDRVPGSDLVSTLAARAAREGRSLFLLGGEPGAAEGAARALTRTHPALRIAGLSSPRFSDPPTEAELEAGCASVVSAAPDLVFVALGSPKTEYVIQHLRSRMPRAWLAGVGISLSFLAGLRRRAPRWMQRSGTEWMHRLAQEPRRLGRRYLLLGVPFALRLLIGARLGRRDAGALGPPAGGSAQRGGARD